MCQLNSSKSHNVCYAIPHRDVSFWIQVDRGDFPCTDIVGEFSIIDDAFQVTTYGTLILSDLSFLKSYVLRRCFSEFDYNLPSRYDGVRRSYAVLHHQNLTLDSACLFNCRCFFEGVDLPSIDFDLSLNIGELKTTTNKEKNNANQN